MFCYKCGKELPDEAEFCIKCGANLSAIKETPNPTTSFSSINTLNPSTQANKFPSWVYVLSGVAVTGLLVLGGQFFISDKDNLSENDGLINQEQSTSSDKQEVIQSTPSEEIEPEELYAEILGTIRQVADNNDFDHTTVGLPYYLGMYWFEGSLADMSYDFVDVNGDNIPELFVFIGEAMVYGIDSTLVSCYTIIDGEVVSLIDTGERFGYFLLKDFHFGYWGSGGAADNSVAILKLSPSGELEYQTYVNTTLEDYMDWDSPVYDYMIAIENGRPNYENRRVATETELAEFYTIFEGGSYQFNYTPFVTQSESEVVLQNFSGSGYINYTDYDPMETPDPSNKTGWDSVWYKGRTTENLCYYGGLNFQYYVEDGGLFITYPDCEYSFYLGYIVNPNMNAGDTLVLDGSEIVLDVIGLTYDANLRLDAYEDYDSLIITGIDPILEDWFERHDFVEIVDFGTFCDFGEKMVEGSIYAPYAFMSINIKQNGSEYEYLPVYVNLRTGRIYANYHEDSIDTWYAQRFG